jgi:hypothetical protein
MSLYIDSFKGFGWKTVFTMSIDIAQYMSLVLLYIGGSWLLASIYAPLASVQETSLGINQYLAETGTLPQLTEELGSVLDGSIAAVQAFHIKLIIVIISSILFSLIISGAFRSMVYGRLSGKALSWRYAWRFTAMNSLWIIVWVFLGTIVYLSLRQNVAVIILLSFIPLYLHLTTSFRLSVTEKGWAQTYSHFYRHGVKKAHRFIIPFFMCVASFIALLFLTYAGRFLPKNLLLFIVFIAAFAYLSWARIYYSLVYKVVA